MRKTMETEYLGLKRTGYSIRTRANASPQKRQAATTYALFANPDANL